MDSPYEEGSGWGESQKQKSPYNVETFLQLKIIFYILAVNGQLL